MVKRLRASVGNSAVVGEIGMGEGRSEARNGSSLHAGTELTAELFLEEEAKLRTVGVRLR